MYGSLWGEDLWPPLISCQKPSVRHVHPEPQNPRNIPKPLTQMKTMKLQSLKQQRCLGFFLGLLGRFLLGGSDFRFRYLFATHRPNKAPTHTPAKLQYLRDRKPKPCKAHEPQKPSTPTDPKKPESREPPQQSFSSASLAASRGSWLWGTALGCMSTFAFQVSSRWA